MNKINVALYGGKGIFGGREAPLEADEIYCDRANVCSFHKDGKCLRCRCFMGVTCKFGRNSVTKGYTSRAKKYNEFKHQYECDECYSKLKYPTEYVALIGDTLFLKTKYVRVRKIEDVESYHGCRSALVNGYDIETSYFADATVFIPITDITNELLYRIFTYNPGSLCQVRNNNEYADKIVVELLYGIKKVAPWMYNSFIRAYPEMHREPNYIGKSIYVNSLKIGTKFNYQGCNWIYDGTHVITNNFEVGYKSPWSTVNSIVEEVKFRVNDKMTIEVNDNSIVDENTVFV